MGGSATDRAKPRCSTSLVVLLILSVALLVWTRANAATDNVADNTPIQPPPAPAARAKSCTHVWMEVTAYCPCKLCCGRRARGLTASGRSVRHNNGRFVAADTQVLPFNTRVSIPGYHDGQPVPVIDTGSAIVGHRLDVFFPSHAAAEEWGRQMLLVRVEPR